MQPKQRILLVSDSKSERDGLALALERRGFGVRVASTFELRFAAAREQPDLALVDVGRLGADHVATLLSDDAVGCPLVLFSDRPSSELRDLAANCGAAGHFQKPAEPEEIVTELEPFLRLPGEESPKPPQERVDFVTLARLSTRGQFVAACPSPFLVSGSNLVARPKGSKTIGMLDDGEPLKSSVTVHAICKTTDTLPDRITVGRAPGADILIEHATLSTIHAHFLRGSGGMQLADAGSRNGTWVCGQLLARDGPPSPVASGDGVRFAELEFTFLSPTAAWDILRVNVK